MNYTVEGTCFRPDEGTLLDSSSLSAISGADHAILYAQLVSAGLPQHGFVVEGLRVTMQGSTLQISPGLALLPDGGSKLVLAPSPRAVELPRPHNPQCVVVATVSERRHAHEATGLQGASKLMVLGFQILAWNGLDLESCVPVASIDLDTSHVDNDVLRLMQPEEPEVVELVRRLRAIIANRLQQEGARLQLEYQGQVQENLTARDHLYMASLQAVILALRARPTLSIERVRMMSELAFQVRTLYRNHPKQRDLIREIVGAGYVDHDHARQMRLENAAARLYNACYAPRVVSAATSGEG